MIPNVHPVLYDPPARRSARFGLKEAAIALIVGALGGAAVTCVTGCGGLSPAPASPANSPGAAIPASIWSADRWAGEYEDGAGDTLTLTAGKNVAWMPYKNCAPAKLYVLSAGLMYMPPDPDNWCDVDLYSFATREGYVRWLGPEETLGVEAAGGEFGACILAVVGGFWMSCDPAALESDDPDVQAQACASGMYQWRHEGCRLPREEVP